MNLIKSSQKPLIGVVGLGYVGLPLAIEFSKNFFTIGFDINSQRIAELKSGYDNTLEVSEKEIKNQKINYTSVVKDLKKCNVYIITVPTPVDNFNNPDMSMLSKASEMVGGILEKGNTIIYESTVYPGATEDFCVPILENSSQLVYNKHFFCGYSPERINPGDKKHTLKTIVKITSGSNSKTADFVDQLYSSIVPAGTHKVSSIAVAESAKVIENVQRDVNISLINELSMIFNKLNINTHEVLSAAATKWNFIPFTPGLVGGHCIGVDPYYLTHKAQEIGHHPEIILAGRRINDSMGKYIADTSISKMVKYGINPISSKVAVLGLTFKENCPDLRNTKVVDIIEQLNSYGCKVIVADPYADPNLARRMYNIKIDNMDKIKNCDAIIVAVSHDEYINLTKEQWNKFLKSKSILIDVKSVIPKKLFSKSDISYWCL